MGDVGGAVCGCVCDDGAAYGVVVLAVRRLALMVCVGVSVGGCVRRRCGWCRWC